MIRARLSLLAAALVLLPLSLSAGDKQTADVSDRMTPQTKLLIMRDLLAERVFARAIFPHGEGGLEIKNGKVLPDSQKVASEVALHGFAAKPGDRVVITNVIIKEKSIVVEINGGGKKHEKWYQHVSVGSGNGTAPIGGGAPQSLEANGSMVVLAFDKYVPEMTGQQVRDMLAPVFDFKALTQVEAYEKTLPPKVQNAIKNHEVLVGMDRDMVVYAKGRPQQRIRDTDDKGVDYEEWIYGAPPEEVQFVRFEGRFVTRLEIMTVDGEKIVRTKKEVDLPSQETQQVAVTNQPKPPGAPTLRRPGEKPDDDDQGGQPMPNTPFPSPTSTMPPGSGMPGPPGTPGNPGGGSPVPGPPGMPPQ